MLNVLPISFFFVSVSVPQRATSPRMRGAGNLTVGSHPCSEHGPAQPYNGDALLKGAKAPAILMQGEKVLRCCAALGDTASAELRLGGARFEARPDILSDFFVPFLNHSRQMAGHYFE